MWKIKRDLKRSLMTTGHAFNDDEYKNYRDAVLQILSSIYVNVLAPLGERYPDIISTREQYMSISP
jgi:CII-binding regulator of phage lambda lysogenization HflD